MSRVEPIQRSIAQSHSLVPAPAAGELPPPLVVDVVMADVMMDHTVVNVRPLGSERRRAGEHREEEGGEDKLLHSGIVARGRTP